MKKILITGNDNIWAIENYYCKYLIELGVDVKILPTNSMIDEKIAKSLFLKILRKFGFMSIYLASNRLLLDTVSSFKPDILWVFKGAEILPETLKEIKKEGIKLVNYNPDHPFIRTFAANGGKNIEQCIPLYDLHFCYSRDLCHRIKSNYNIPAVHLPFGFELSEEIYNSIKTEPEVHKVTFIGNPDKERSRIVDLLASQGISIDVFGFGWDKYLVANEHIQIFNAINGREFWSTMRKYRINLNIFRPHNVNSHNMRTFEIPACGGIMLAPESQEHNDFFEKGKEIFTYRDDHDLIDKCKYILGLTVQEAEQIRINARNASITKDYSYKKNAERVFNSLTSLYTT